MKANTVYRLGNWEYAYTFRGAPLSASYAALRFGGFMLELKSHLQAKVSRTSTVLLGCHDLYCCFVF